MRQDSLKLDGEKVSKKHATILMNENGDQTFYRKPNTSKRHLDYKTSYLLGHMEVDRSNQVWTMDITYLPMARGFVYLAAVVDWYSRKVLS
jgi:putative transposase